MSLVKDRFDQFEKQVNELFDRLEQQVPSQVQELLTRARSGGEEARSAVQSLIDSVTDALGATSKQVENNLRDLVDQVRNFDGDVAGLVSDAVNEATGQIRAITETAAGLFARAGQEVTDAADKATASAQKLASTGKKVTAEAKATQRKVDDGPTGSYESWTKAELYDRAQELDIDGRSNMTKKQLIAALRKAG